MHIMIEDCDPPLDTIFVPFQSIVTRVQQGKFWTILMSVWK